MMDDAKIGGISSNNASQKEQGLKPIFPDKIPSVLTTDDLVFEIGKYVIKCANAEKAVEKILEREKTFRKEAMEKITALQKQIQEKDEFVKKAEEIRKSNQAYQEKNQALDKALVEARIEVSELKKKLKEKLDKGKKKKPTKK